MAGPKKRHSIVRRFWRSLSGKKEEETPDIAKSKLSEPRPSERIDLSRALPSFQFSAHSSTNTSPGKDTKLDEEERRTRRASAPLLSREVESMGSIDPEPATPEKFQRSTSDSSIITTAATVGSPMRNRKKSPKQTRIVIRARRLSDMHEEEDEGPFTPKQTPLRNLDLLRSLPPPSLIPKSTVKRPVRREWGGKERVVTPVNKPRESEVQTQQKQHIRMEHQRMHSISTQNDDPSPITPETPVFGTTPLPTSKIPKLDFKTQSSKENEKPKRKSTSPGPPPTTLPPNPPTKPKIPVSTSQSQSRIPILKKTTGNIQTPKQVSSAVKGSRSRRSGLKTSPEEKFKHEERARIWSS